jgi:hypothetical protein
MKDRSTRQLRAESIYVRNDGYKQRDNTLALSKKLCIPFKAGDLWVGKQGRLELHYEAREDPDSILLKPSDHEDAWDPWTATALEAEVWPEKHPPRVAWHVLNDLDNLEFARVLFAVSDDAKRDSLLKILGENCYSHLDRISVETIAATRNESTTR